MSYLIYRDFVAPDVPQTEPVVHEVALNYGVPELEIPDTVMFAGERVPIEIADVRERLDRELHVNTFWHSNTIFLLKRGYRWLPQIDSQLISLGVPTDLKYIAVIESDLKNKVSPMKAVGFWQILKGTARDYRMEVNSEVDERYDPIKSTVVAGKYLKKAHDKFGNWASAVASYNIGMTGLQRLLRKQSVTSYYDLLVGEETSRYVFRAIAIKIIFENPEKYGFDLSEEQLYSKEKVRYVEVSSSIKDLKDWAFEQGINYKLLKRHNPWLRNNSLTIRNGKKYRIAIPLNEPLEVIDN